MSAIFISYTNRDEDGQRWALWLMERLRAWKYESRFLDKDETDGIRVGDDWRRELHQKLAHCRVVIAICSSAYETSPWCMAEVGIAVDRGKRLFPVVVGGASLPLLLQHSQSVSLSDSIQVTGSPDDTSGALLKLRESLDNWLDWRDKLKWKQGECPFPGLDAFQERYAPVFFGRDAAIAKLRERVNSLSGVVPAFLLLLGASGYGKSSLVRAGLLPGLKSDANRPWLVLEPFRPGRTPLARLEGVVADAFRRHGQSPPAEPLRTGTTLADQLEALRRLGEGREAPAVIVIDQLEELLAEARQSGAEEETSEGERFLAVLLELLHTPLAGVLVIATLRTDALAPLQAMRPDLFALASHFPLEPIQREDYGELISGPAARSGWIAQPGLPERLVHESGSGDALPLLAFTLEKLWRRREQRGTAVAGPEGQWWDLTLDDSDALGGGVGGGGVAGVVSQQAGEVWQERTSSKDDTAALRGAFLDHLVRLGEDGLATKQAARWSELPAASKPLLERFVAARLLVTGKGDAQNQVEIAHEALLRTWPTLVKWLSEGREELLQRRRVERLCADLTAEKAEPLRRTALEELARMAAGGGGESRAVAKEALAPLTAMLHAPQALEWEREDAALLLALIGAAEPLRECLADGEAPVAVRRRAAESLGLLASRCGDPARCAELAKELEGWMRKERVDVWIVVGKEPAVLEEMRPAARKQVANQVEQARAAGQLKGVGEAQLRGLVEQAEDEACRSLLWASGKAPGWAEHDACLPLLQGASRGVQLAASAALPLVGRGPGRVVPMLTLSALAEEGGLRVRTEVVEVPVWRLPLPELAGEGPQQLELVVVPGGDYVIGSPEGEEGRDVYRRIRQGCEGIEVEVRRRVRLESFALLRHPITQAQWRAVVEATPEEGRGNLTASPGTYKPERLWERYGQPGALPVDIVSWNDCQEWLKCLNAWITGQWPLWAGQHPALPQMVPQLALPSESLWEAACRARQVENESDPRADSFAFGATLDPSWANYDGNTTYGLGRKGIYRQRPVSIGFFGLVNRLGLADMHGQLFEWCADQWHRNPLPEAQRQRHGWLGRRRGKPEPEVLDGAALDGPDPGLAQVPLEQAMRLLRGGSWFNGPRHCRSAFRSSLHPASRDSIAGFRVCCLPPGLILYT